MKKSSILCTHIMTLSLARPYLHTIEFVCKRLFQYNKNNVRVFKHDSDNLYHNTIKRKLLIDIIYH